MAAAALLTLSVLIGGLVLGYRLSNASKDTPRAGTAVNLPKERLAAIDSAALTMPDLAGLTRDQAMEALTDAGVDSKDITVNEKPWAGQSGVVVAQQPVRGSDIPDGVEFAVSTAATVPDLVGKTEAEAAAAIEAQGALLERNYVYERNQTAPRVVLRTTPAAGEPLTGTVVADVSVEPTSLYLTQVRPDEADCSTTSDTVVLGSLSTEQALVCRSRASSSSSSNATVYLVATRADRFTATVGIPASEEPGSKARILVVVDGQTVADHPLEWNQAVPLDLDMRGKTRLEFVVVPPDPDDSSAAGTEVVILDGTLYGAPDELDQLPHEGS